MKNKQTEIKKQRESPCLFYSFVKETEINRKKEKERERKKERKKERDKESLCFNIVFCLSENRANLEANFWPDFAVTEGKTNMNKTKNNKHE